VECTTDVDICKDVFNFIKPDDEATSPLNKVTEAGAKSIVLVAHESSGPLAAAILAAVLIGLAASRQQRMRSVILHHLSR
jgi:hypothetical protein